MSDNQRAAESVQDPAHGAVLRAGRAADPLPVSSQASAQGTSESPEALVEWPVETAGQAELTPGQEPEQGTTSPGSEDESGSGDVEKALAQSRQRQLRLMLRQCDRVLLMDFELLAMNDWPDNYTLATARRSRDLWLFSALVAALVFLSGLTGWVPAWVAGTGFGAFVIILLLGVPSIRRIYNSAPSYLEVIVKRQRMLRDARAHIAHLEGSDGLIWQCARMREFNSALKHARFGNLLRLSEQRALPSRLTRREYVRLYLIYLLEAEKAYGRVQKAFFAGNEQALDQGWQDVAAEPDSRT